MWAYCRVSTTKEEQEESLDAQATWAQEFARAKHCELIVVREQASAKTTVGRPRFNAMMADLAALPKGRRPQFLVVTSLDRLSRNTRDTLNVIEALRELNVTLFQRGLGPITAEDFPRLAALVGMSLAGEAENYARSLRMLQSWDKRRAEGKPTSNKVPYGLQLRGGRDVIIPESGAWVLHAFEWYASGTGMYKIARWFAEGAPDHTWLTSKIDENGERIAKTRKATKWESNRIRKLLEQKRYRETIVPADLFKQVHERLSKTPRRGSRRIREYPLSGAMVCEGCRRHLHGVASGGYMQRTMADGTIVHWMDSEARRRYYECYICRYRHNAARLEAEFFSVIGTLHADDAMLNEWVAQPRLHRSASVAMRRELARLEIETSDEQEAKRRDRVFDLALAAKLDESELRRQLERIKGDVATKRERAAVLRDQLAATLTAKRTVAVARDLLQSFHVLYEQATYEQKRELLSAVSDALGGVTVSATGLHWAHRNGENTGSNRRSKGPRGQSKPKRQSASA
jgi:DNA invertase Pin-like site-specific DNA recombinase